MQTQPNLLSQYNNYILLKNHNTLITNNSNSTVPWLVRTGNPGMASAGMGDVLTGVAAALYAQCPDADTATIAAAAAWLHGTAGDRVAAQDKHNITTTNLFTKLKTYLNN